MLFKLEELVPIIVKFICLLGFAYGGIICGKIYGDKKRQKKVTE